MHQRYDEYDFSWTGFHKKKDIEKEQKVGLKIYNFNSTIKGKTLIIFVVNFIQVTCFKCFTWRKQSLNLATCLEELIETLKTKIHQNISLWAVQR